MRRSLLLWLALSVFCGAMDWYSNYVHNDGSLLGHFSFNGGSPQDAVSRRSVTLHGAQWVSGWVPQDGYVFDGKGRMELSYVQEHRDFTLAVYGRVTGGGDYLVLRKGAYGLGFRNGKVSVYLRCGGKDNSLAGGAYDSGWHFWVLTVAGQDAAFYCDGALVGRKRLPSLVATSEEPLLVGHSGGWGKQSIIGAIKSLSIYSRALSAEEVAAQAKSFAAGQRPEPAGGLEFTRPVGASTVFYKDDVSYEAKEQALHFNGKDAYATLPDYPAFQSLKALTVGAWIKPERTMPKRLEEQGYIVSHNSGAHVGWMLGTYYSNGLQAMVVTDQGKYSVSAAQVLKPNVWQHVAFGWDGARLQLFVNGVPVGASVPTKGVLKPFRGRACLGKAADRDGLYFQGAIDEVRLYTAGLLPEADPDTGKEVVAAASNTDPDPDPRHLPPFRGTAGCQPEIQPLVDFEDLTGWTVSTHRGIAEASFVRSQDDRLWGDYTGKLTVRLGKVYDPALRKATIRPPKPIVIDKPFDYAEMWVSAQNWAQAVNKPKLRLLFTGADGKKFEVDTTASEHPFLYWSGWGLSMKRLPEPPKTPATFDGFVIYDFSGSKPNVFYLDNLAVFQMPKQLPPGVNIPAWEEIGIRNAGDGVAMPAASAQGRALSPVADGRSFRFAGDGQAWVYVPRTGTLRDIRLEVVGKGAITPLSGGGFRFVRPDGAEIQPDDPKLSAKLLKVAPSASAVRSEWQWNYAGAPLEKTALTLSVRGGTLSIRLESAGGAVREVLFGEATGLKSPKVTTIPYWVTRGRGVSDPGVCYSDGVVLSEFVDIYATHASELLGGSKATGASSVQLNGGVRYNRRSDGTRNPVSELFHVTAADAVEKVLPHIPNPPNPMREITQHGLWMTTMWYDTMPQPRYFTRSFARMKLLHDYGIRNLFARDHQSLNRQYSPKRRGGWESMITEICPDLEGGDPGAKIYFERSTKELGYRMGLYSNYTLMSPTTTSEMSRSKVTLDSDGNPRYGSGDALQYKYSYILDCQRRLNPILKGKFNLTCSYPDQYTCRAPWSFTDYDARVPEAGSVSPVLRVLAKSLMEERDCFGPVLSEGIMQWPLAGYCDSYAQTGAVDDPLFPEFQLREIHPLSNDCGSHLSIICDRQPGAVDRLLALTLGNGNIAHIFGIYGGKPPLALTYPTLKSYYAIVQAQKHYANVPVKRIRYHVGGKMLTATEVLAAGAVAHSQVHVEYANGFEVWANANGTESWEIVAGGRRHLLPPYGYWMAGPGMAEGGSEILDGRRVDSLRGDLWLFANGNGKPVNLGFLACKGAYAVLWENGMAEVIGLPEALDETVAIDLKALPVQPGATAVYLKHDGTVLRRAAVKTEGGKLFVTMSKDCYKVQLTQ